MTERFKNLVRWINIEALENNKFSINFLIPSIYVNILFLW